MIKTKKTIAPVASLGLLLGLCAISSAAFADAPAAAEPAAGAPRPMVPPPPFSALPSASMTVPPKDKAPKRIPKTEKVEGFYVADPPKNQLREGKITNVIIFGKEDDAKEYTAGKRFGAAAADETQCFSQPPRFRRPNDESPVEWAPEIEPTATIQAPIKQPPPPKKGEKPKPYKMEWGDMEVTAVHQERFILQEDKKARVEITDAWVDPMTHGVRLIGKSTMSLERIGSASHGVKLYAAKGDKRVHIVARRALPKEATKLNDRPSKSFEFKIFNAVRHPLMIETPAGERDQTMCGFAHVSLKAEKGTAETAMFETATIFIDPLEPKPEKTEEEVIAEARANHEEETPTVRVRPFRATVSSTWTSRDVAPVISVSFGWAGREREL